MAVVIVHAFASVGGKYASVRMSAPAIASEYGYLGVELFYVISGYCITHAAVSTILSGRSAGSYFRARIRRIYPPYWLSLPIFVALNQIARYMRSHGHAGEGTSTLVDISHNPLSVITSNVLLLQNPVTHPLFNGVAWTLCYEVAFYVVVGVALVLARKAGARVLLMLLHLFTMGCLAALIFAPPRTIVYPLDMWPEFGLGVLAYDVLRNKYSKASVAFAGGIILLTIACILRLIAMDSGHWWEALPVHHESLNLLVSLSFALLIVFLHPFDGQISKTLLVRAFAWLGLFSYSIYLIHTGVLGVYSMVAKMGHYPDRTIMLYLLIVFGIVISVACSWIFFQFGERPFINAATRPSQPAEEFRQAPAAAGA